MRSTISASFTRMLFSLTNEKCCQCCCDTKNSERDGIKILVPVLFFLKIYGIKNFSQSNKASVWHLIFVICAYACALCPLYFHFVELTALQRGRVILPVVKEELLSLQNGTFGEDSNAVVSVHHNHCNATHEIQRIMRLFSRSRCLNSGVTTHQNKSHLLRSSWDLRSG